MPNPILSIFKILNTLDHTNLITARNRNCETDLQILFKRGRKRYLKYSKYRLHQSWENSIQDLVKRNNSACEIFSRYIMRPVPFCQRNYTQRGTMMENVKSLHAVSWKCIRCATCTRLHLQSRKKLSSPSRAPVATLPGEFYVQRI